MTPLEIRIIAYAVLLGLFAWGVHTLDAHHYERVAAAERHAQDVALQASKDQAIADLQRQQAAAQAAEKQNEDLKASYAGLAQHLADSVRQYASLRAVIVSQATAAPKPDAASPGTGSHRGLAELSGSAAGACLEDAAALSALQTWARQVSQ